MRKALTYLVKMYQYFLSPHMGECCCFTPSCSAYAILALRQCRLPMAIYLIIWRLLRCHPWSKGGFDPIPDRCKVF